MADEVPAPGWLEQTEMHKKLDAADMRREAAKVEQRAATRLTLADQRNQAAKDTIDEDTRRHQGALSRDVLRAEHELAAFGQSNEEQLVDLAARRREREVQADQYVSARDSARRRVEAVRTQRDLQAEKLDNELVRTSQQAEAQIASQKSSVRAKLDALGQQSLQREAHRTRLIEAQEQQSQAALDDLRQRSNAEALGSEGYRHRAAMSVNRVGELQQAAKSEAAAKAQLTEARATEQASRLARQRFEVEWQADAAVKDVFKASVAELDAAHRHCNQVKAGTAIQATDCARRALQLEQAAEVRAREAERQVAAAAASRLEEFANGASAVQETEERLQAGRSACEAMLQGLYNRLQELEAETRAKAAEIMEQWDQGSRATEQDALGCERRGREALAELRAAMGRLQEEARGQSASLQSEGSAAVAALERRANSTVDGAQAALEAARRADEEATVEAQGRLRALRPLAPRVEAEADARVAGLAAQAAGREEQLRQEAEARLARAKAATADARREEEVLLAEASKAWERLRKASYQLRLMNLHDFAEGIAAGDFDEPSERILVEDIAAGPEVSAGLTKTVRAAT